MGRPNLCGNSECGDISDVKCIIDDFGGRRIERIGGVAGVVESYGNGPGVVHQANALDKYSSTTRRARAPPIGEPPRPRGHLLLLCLCCAFLVHSSCVLIFSLFVLTCVPCFLAHHFDSSLLTVDCADTTAFIVSIDCRCGFLPKLSVVKAFVLISNVRSIVSLNSLMSP